MKQGLQTFVLNLLFWLLLIGGLIAFACYNVVAAPAWMTPYVAPVKSPKDAATPKSAAMAPAAAQVAGQPSSATVAAFPTNWFGVSIEATTNFVTWATVTNGPVAQVATVQRNQFFRAKKLSDTYPLKLAWNPQPPDPPGYYFENFNLYGTTNGSTALIAQQIFDPNVTVTLVDANWTFTVKASYLDDFGESFSSPASNVVPYKQPQFDIKITQP